MDDKPSARADFISAIIWIVFGGCHRLRCVDDGPAREFAHQPYTAPGLVPGILGASIVLMGVLLALRSLRAGALTPAGAPAPVDDDRRAAMGRVALALVLCLIFGAGLVGHGPPFWVATILFVFAFIVAFQWHERTSTQARLRGAGIRAGGRRRCRGVRDRHFPGAVPGPSAIVRKAASRWTDSFSSPARSSSTCSR